MIPRTSEAYQNIPQEREALRHKKSYIGVALGSVIAIAGIAHYQHTPEPPAPKEIEISAPCYIQKQDVTEVRPCYQSSNENS